MSLRPERRAPDPFDIRDEAREEVVPPELAVVEALELGRVVFFITRSFRSYSYEPSATFGPLMA
jgi:hypothetical protein